jgi:hypothetical protein
VLHPIHGSPVQLLGNGDVAHRGLVGGAMPIAMSGRAPDDVSGPDFHDCFSFALRPAAAFCNEQVWPSGWVCQVVRAPGSNVTIAPPARAGSARVLARLMTSVEDGLAKSEAILVAVIQNNVPELVTARKAIGDFPSMIRSKSAIKLDGWIAMSKGSLVSSFVNGVEKAPAAVRNAIVSPWSNGQTEGQITCLKLIKRQMYGRARLSNLTYGN